MVVQDPETDGQERADYNEGYKPADEGHCVVCCAGSIGMRAWRTDSILAETCLGSFNLVIAWLRLCGPLVD